MGEIGFEEVVLAANTGTVHASTGNPNFPITLGLHAENAPAEPPQVEIRLTRRQFENLLDFFQMTATG